MRSRCTDSQHGSLARASRPNDSAGAGSPRVQVDLAQAFERFEVKLVQMPLFREINQSPHGFILEERAAVQMDGPLVGGDSFPGMVRDAEFIGAG